MNQCVACGAHHDGNDKLCPGCRQALASGARVQELQQKLKDEYIKLRLIESKFRNSLNKVHGHLEELGDIAWLKKTDVVHQEGLSPDERATAAREMSVPARQVSEAPAAAGEREREEAVQSGQPTPPTQQPIPPSAPSFDSEDMSFGQAASRQDSPSRAVPPQAARPEPSQPAGAGFGRDSDLEAKLGQKVMLIVGIITMIFGVGFFLKYSFDQGWIPPAGRVAMAYLWGLAFLGGGEMFRRKGYELYGLYIVACGVAVLYFSTWAGFAYYGLMGQTVSFGLMILTTALAMALAVKYDAKGLAVLGTVGGFLTPLLLSTGSNNQMVLMGYMAVLNAGILWVAFFKRWNLLNWLGCVATFMLYLGWLFSYHSCEAFWASIGFLNLFACTYMVIPYLFDLGSEKKASVPGAVLAMFASYVGMGINLFLVGDCYNIEAASVASLGYTALFLALATALYQAGRGDRPAFHLYVSQAALFLALSVPIMLDGEWVTVSLALQAAAMLWVSGRLQVGSLAVGAVVLMGIVVGKLFMVDYGTIYNIYGHGGLAETMKHGQRVLSEIVVAGCLGFMGKMVVGAPLGKGKTQRYVAGLILLSLAGVAFLTISLETSILFSFMAPDYSYAALTILWAAFASVFILASVRMPQHLHITARILLFTGMALMAVALGKFILYDFDRAYGLAMSHSLQLAVLHAPRVLTELFIVAGLFLAVARAVDLPVADEGSRDALRSMFYIVLGVFLFLILSLETSILFTLWLPDALRPALSVLWTVFSAILMMLGFKYRSFAMRITAIVLFGVTVLKVFLLDMAEVSTPYRIVSFIILGLLLVGCSFLYYRFRDTIKESLGGQEEGHG